MHIYIWYRIHIVCIFIYWSELHTKRKWDSSTCPKNKQRPIGWQSCWNPHLAELKAEVINLLLIIESQGKMRFETLDLGAQTQLNKLEKIAASYREPWDATWILKWLITSQMTIGWISLILATEYWWFSLDVVRKCVWLAHDDQGDQHQICGSRTQTLK